MTTDHTHVTLGHTDTGPLRIDVPTLIDTRQVITASSGGGKSFLLRRLIELIARQVQVIVIDPEGEFNTLREKFDMLLVGQGGEIAPEVHTAGKLARKLAELRVSAIIDLYDLGDWDARRAYLAPFLDGLMNLPKADYHPIYVPIDEAHQFAPESAGGAKDSPVAASRRAIRFLMSAGRKRAICGALATQRISKLDKDSMADAKNVFIGGITLDVDQERAGDMLGLAKAERIQLRDLAPGTFYAFGPALPREVSRFLSDPVITTHPRAGQRHLLEVPPASGAIQKIVAELADIPRQVQAEADELAAARRQVAELQRELRVRPMQMQLAAPEKVVERVEVTVFRDGEVGRLEAAVQTLATVGSQFVDFGQQIAAAGNQFQAASAEVGGALKATVSRLSAPAPVRSGPIGPAPRPTPLAHTKSDKPAGQSAPSALPRGEETILAALIQYPNGLRREQLTVLSGYKRSSRDTYLQRLRERGYVVADGDRLMATAEGAAAVLHVQPLPTGAALREHWLSRLPQGERAILEVLIARYPAPVERSALDELTPYKRSSRDTYLMRLAAKELVVSVGRGAVKASEELFD